MWLYFSCLLSRQYEVTRKGSAHLSSKRECDVRIGIGVHTFYGAFYEKFIHQTRSLFTIQHHLRKPDGAPLQYIGQARSVSFVLKLGNKKVSNANAMLGYLLYHSTSDNIWIAGKTPENMTAHQSCYVSFAFAAWRRQSQKEAPQEQQQHDDEGEHKRASDGLSVVVYDSGNVNISFWRKLEWESGGTYTEKLSVLWNILPVPLCIALELYVIPVSHYCFRQQAVDLIRFKLPWPHETELFVLGEALLWTRWNLHWMGVCAFRTCQLSCI